ncbi:ATP-binding protein [Bacillus cereus]|uniref:ATP-binding protein n=1 Tax=Bacillus cereus TaxID=1396 RepID=UPI001C54C383|nr:ATP-binding protein [Bacillus cereus]
MNNLFKNNNSHFASITKDTLIKSNAPIKVIPNDNLFKELGKNTYKLKDLMSELIDNPLGAMLNQKKYKINVDLKLYIDEEENVIRFVISDDSVGIPESFLGKAITPAGHQTSDSLNEHGLGMKQAVSGLGDLEYLITKTHNEKIARAIFEFKFGEIETYHYPSFPYQHGTEISIINLKDIIKVPFTSIKTQIIPYLGARYRRYLQADSKLLNLRFIIIKVSETEEGELSTNVEHSINIEEFKPIYFHPSKRTNKPIINKMPLRDKHGEWEAELTFGYAPNKDEKEYEELGLSNIPRYHPYSVSLSKQGLDIILQDRVIRFHQLSELGITNSKHNIYNTVRGELDLKRGFYTTTTKTDILHSKQFKECIDLVKEILNGNIEGPNKIKKNYLQQINYPEKLPEKLIRNRLAYWLKNNPLLPKKSVKTEYPVGNIEGFIDILADNEVWEIKLEQAAAYDVYQLFMYLDVGGFNKGILLAPSFSTGCINAIEHANQNHNVTITPQALKADKFPILHPPSYDERLEYY